ncbi:MAG: hypothetical protein LUD78_12065 [Clostridiales bacterium]|nr:hypothetical protein [Clostridiales bacterium]
MKLFSKVVRRIPPFRNLYHRIDALEKEDTALKKNLSAAQIEAEQQYKTLAQRDKALEQQCKALEQQCKVLEQQCKALEQQCKLLKKQVDTNEKRFQEIVEQEQKDCAALRDEIAAVKKTAAERDKRYQEQFKKMQQTTERTLAAKIGSTRRDMVAEMNYLYFKGLHPDQYADALKEWYYQRTGHELNLEHPRTYTEKIQWLKLYDSTPLKGELSDKYLVRNYVRKKIGEKYLVPLLGVWDRVDDIPFDDLPKQYALKATHGSGWNIIVKDKTLLNVEDAKRKLNKWMRTNFAYHSLELHYKSVRPKIIAEEYMENKDGDIYDYKVFCFDGKARYIMFLSQRAIGLKMAVYDTEWNLMPFVYGVPRLEQEVPKPDNLEELITAAEKLAEGFCFVRVDFYLLNNGAIKFGEMTFTSNSGQSMWEPVEYEQKLGDMIHLPCDEREAQ